MLNSKDSSSQNFVLSYRSGVSLVFGVILCGCGLSALFSVHSAPLKLKHVSSLFLHLPPVPVPTSLRLGLKERTQPRPRLGFGFASFAFMGAQMLQLHRRARLQGRYSGCMSDTSHSLSLGTPAVSRVPGTREAFSRVTEFNRISVLTQPWP